MFGYSPTPNFFGVVATNFRGLVRTMFIYSQRRFPSLRVVEYIGKGYGYRLGLFFYGIVGLQGRPADECDRISLASVGSSIFYRSVCGPRGVFVVVGEFPHSRSRGVKGSFSYRDLCPMCLVRRF